MTPRLLQAWTMGCDHRFLQTGGLTQLCVAQRPLEPINRTVCGLPGMLACVVSFTVPQAIARQEETRMQDLIVA